jgi:hypothetical protein
MEEEEERVRDTVAWGGGGSIVILEGFQALPP